MKDICLIEKIPEIIKLQIPSIRINGWLKSPFYIYHVTRIYKKAIENYYKNNFYVPEEDKNFLRLSLRRQLTESFFTKEKNMICTKSLKDTGIYIGKFFDNQIYLKDTLKKGDTISFMKGNKIIQLKINYMLKGEEIIEEAKAGDKISLHFFSFKNGIEVYKTAITEQKFTEYKKFPLNINIKISVNLPTEIIVNYKKDNKEKTLKIVDNEIIKKANNKPLKNEDLEKIFRRLKNTPFEIKTFNSEINENARLSFSQINKLKKKLIKEIMLSFISSNKEKIELVEKNNSKKDIIINNKKPEFYIKVYDLDGIEKAIEMKADIIYYDIFSADVLDAINYAKKKKVKLFLITPRIIYDNTYNHIIKLIEHYNPDGIIIGDKSLITEKLKLEKHIDYNFNISNSISKSFWKKPCVLSVELNFSEICNIEDKDSIIFLYGSPIVMTSRIELRQNELINDKGEKFRIIKTPYKETMIIQDKKIDLIENIKELYNNGFYKFFIEAKENVEEILESLKETLSEKKEYSENKKISSYT
jgi:U32 family peptidase